MSVNMHTTTYTRPTRPVTRPRIVCDDLGKWQETFARCAVRENYAVEDSDNGGEDYWQMVAGWTRADDERMSR